MYISSRLLLRAIEELKRVHPFHGVTFLVCKQQELPVDRPVEFAMDALTRNHMDTHHKLAPASGFYFQPFRSNKHWLKHDYPSSGLQAINTQTFKSAFIHDPGSRTWAWHRCYLTALEEKLISGRKIPAWALAVWLYRSKDRNEEDDLRILIRRFKNEYHITLPECKKLFDTRIPEDLSQMRIFTGSRSRWDDLRHTIEPPPDAIPERGGTLTFLHVHGTGPAADMVFRPARRLTIVTGDNGLGKSFLMDCAWWALTGNWASHPALPALEADEVYIEFGIRGSADSPEEKSLVNYDRNRHEWPLPIDSRRTIPGLIIYARVDGSFAVWDPIGSGSDAALAQGSFVLSNDQIWHGRSGMNEGLIRDWVKWQNSPNKYPFEELANVLKRLSPPDLGELKAGETIRIPQDPREIPTVVHKYGVTPVLYASAGIKRILALSYLMVWAWSEHLIAAKLAGRPPEDRMVVLVDEMEAHLHPKWQRSVLPALSSISTCLERDLALQLLVATHSPLVVASAEAIFDSEKDALIHLDILESGEIGIEDIPFTKHGEISSWLTSPIFQLKQARSREAEGAIEEAKLLQMKGDTTKADVERVSNMLTEHLPSDDRFWPRWVTFAEGYGVEL